jgi:hypothetical protein
MLRAAIVVAVLGLAGLAGASVPGILLLLSVW